MIEPKVVAEEQGSHIKHTHTHEHTRLGAAQFKCNLVVLAMEQAPLEQQGGSLFCFRAMSFCWRRRGVWCLILWRRSVWLLHFLFLDLCPSPDCFCWESDGHVMGFKEITLCFYHLQLWIIPSVIHTSPMFPLWIYCVSLSSYICPSSSLYLSYSHWVVLALTCAL